MAKNSSARASSGVRSTAKAARPFVIYGLLRTYHEFGSFSFKVVVHPSLVSRDVGVELIDSEGRTIPCERSDWGRKLRCTMSIQDSVSEGMALVTVSVGEKKFYERFRVVKP